MFSLGIAASNLVGPLAVGLSIDARGHAQTYLLIALVPLAAIAWLASGPGFLACARIALGKEAPRPSFVMPRERPGLRRVLIAGGAIETGIELYTFYMPIYGQAIGSSATQIGVIIGIHAAALMAIRFLMPLPNRARRSSSVRSGRASA